MRISLKFVIIILGLLYSSGLCIYAQKPSGGEEPVTYEYKNYYFVMLTKGPHRNQDSTAAIQIQKGHMDNIERLVKEGKIQVAGPFLDNGEWRGVFIFDVATKEEVEQLLQTDPAISSGRLAYEIHPWMTAKGVCFK